MTVITRIWFIFSDIKIKMTKHDSNSTPNFARRMKLKRNARSVNSTSSKTGCLNIERIFANIAVYLHWKLSNNANFDAVSSER
jgi:hypothetical protein